MTIEQQALFPIPESVASKLTSESSMLPGCPADKRQLPNEIVRSALFSAKNRKSPRTFLQDVSIKVIGGGEIIFRGEELRQDDEVVWMHLVHLATKVPMGHPVEFTAYEFIKGINKSINAQNYRSLHLSLVRMMGTAIQFPSLDMKKGTAVSLITGFDWCEEDCSRGNKYRVSISLMMRRLFDNASWLDWEMRRMLPDGIASKLMSFWASHRNPLPVATKILKKDLCNLDSSDKEFNRLLKNACDALVSVGFLQFYAVNKGVVTVIRKTGEC